MTGIQLNTATKGLLAKIQVMTGWRIPQGDQESMEAYEKIFYDELEKLILEKAGNMTLMEFEYAIRTYGREEKDFAKPIHMGLIIPCIEKYLSYRVEISELEENSKMWSSNGIEGPKNKELNHELTDWSYWYLKLVESAKNGQIKSQFVRVGIYDWLKEQGRVDYDSEKMWRLMVYVMVVYKEDMQMALLQGGLSSIPPDTRDRIKQIDDVLSWEQMDQRVRCLKVIKKNNHPLISLLSVLAKQEIIKEIAIKDAKNIENDSENK